ncbi:MAG: hypothetical protein ACFFD1_04560 [Candidatus Thorarchaeota archaeon]
MKGVIDKYLSGRGVKDISELKKRMADAIDEEYKKHSNKVSHTFIFIIKQKLLGDKSNENKIINEEELTEKDERRNK